MHKRALDRSRNYKRDNRSPIPSSEIVSRVMSANKGKDTGPELAFRRALWSKGMRGYRLHMRTIPGSPDIAYRKRKIAIFINGCFWHRCPKCNLPLPKSNTEYWKDKFERNVLRDERKTNDLRALGWKVITIWECEITEDLQDAISRVEKALESIEA